MQDRPTDLLTRNLHTGRGAATAFIDRTGARSFADVADAACRFGALLEAAGLQPGARILLALLDSVTWPVCFLGAMRAGFVPVPLNTLLTAEDYAFIAADSQADAVVADPPLLPLLPADLPHCWLTDSSPADGTWTDLPAALAQMPSPADAALQAEQDMEAGFWLYTSGTTGKPKGVIHRYADLLATAENYGSGVLQLNEQDVVFSAAKLFFAYGLGNAMTFPMYAGATSILLDGPPAPDSVRTILEVHQPTVFFGVPTLYAMLLNTGNLPAEHRLRVCVSAGEALPEAIFERWRGNTGSTILDGIGSTEMLHIYMSNRLDAVTPGASGTPVAGIDVQILDDNLQPVQEAEVMGDLYVCGASLSSGYWQRPELNQAAFSMRQGKRWLRSGDKYLRNADGAYVYCGRSDDLLKVGGIYVSPMEVENALLQHPWVAEAAVVGCEDDDQLTKPKAFVVKAEQTPATDPAATEQTLIDHVSSLLAAYKRPRWVEVVDELPKTATGKIQRFKLRNP